LVLDISSNNIEYRRLLKYWNVIGLIIWILQSNRISSARNGKFCPKTKLLFSNVEPLILSLRLSLERMANMSSIISSLQV
jgi:hypothetical protein